MQPKFKTLKRKEREIIDTLYNIEHKSIRNIAKILQRSPSTISREIKRNQINGEYESQKANVKAYKRYSWKKSFPFSDPKYQTFINLFNLLYKKQYMKIEPTIEFIKHNYTNIAIPSTKTVYKWVNDRNWNQEKLQKIRHKSLTPKRSTGIKRLTHNKYVFPIGLRPKHIDDRKEFGHWEIDLVIGLKRSNTDNILTFNERKSRFFIAKRVRSKNPLEINKVLNRIITDLWNLHIPVLSITSDNGFEFNKLQFVAKKFQLNIYKAEPYCSFQRGSNENSNGLFRRRYRKGTDFTKVSDKAIEKTVWEINNLPRKILGWKCSNQILQDEMDKLNKEIEKLAELE
ncbi:IS30 family transposase [Mycoplasma hafezii]|uniref:IS30 family transposase n=1 Tax=Mycoplasma hafezii TaxID=525886 RepID=UPI003CEA85C7